MAKQRDARIAIVGAGLMGSTHASTLTFSTKNVVISHIVDNDLARAADVAEPIEGAVATRALQPALEDCDGVIITAPDEYHRELIEQALAAGKPVLCEKPLATTLEDCLELLKAESELSRPLISLGFMRRFDPGYRALRRLITEGNDGALLMSHSVHRNPSSAEGTTAAAIQSLPIHEFDMLHWLSAEQIVSVAAFAGKRSSNAARGLHDPMLFVCTTTSGVIGHIQMYSNARYGYEVRCEVLCEDGAADLDGMYRSANGLGNSAVAAIEPGVCRDWRDRFANAYRLELQTWVNSVINPLEASIDLATAYDGYAAFVTAQAAIKSIESGEPVATNLAESRAILSPAGISSRIPSSDPETSKR